MADIADLITPGDVLALGGGLAGLGRWALRLWADVRREGIAAAIIAAAKREAFEGAIAAAASRDSARMVDALLAQATSSTALAGAQAALTQRIDQLSSKLDGIARDREWTPVEGMPAEHADPEESASTRAPSSDSQRGRGRLRTVPKGVPLTGWRPPRPGTNHDE